MGFNNDRGGNRRFGNRSSGGRDFGGSRGGFGRDRNERPSMHRAICSDCGNECEVPFRPTGDKPVYCSDCFRRNGESSGGRDFGNDRGSFGGRKDRSDRRDRGGRDFGEKRMFQTVCSECGNSCEVPFKPSGDKPVYCDSCFGSGDGKSKKTDTYREEFEKLNAKLDRLIKVLEASGLKKEPTIIKIKDEIKKEEVIEKKPIEKKKVEKKEKVKKEVKKEAVSKKTVKTKKKSK